MTAITLLIVVLLVADMIASVFKVNEHASQTYRYTPFALGNFFAILPAYFAAFAGLMFEDSPSALNAMVMYCAGIAYLLYQVVRLANKTNFGIALYSVFVMTLAWAPIMFLLLLRQSPKHSRGHH
jgi:hypothetical protein